MRRCDAAPLISLAGYQPPTTVQYKMTKKSELSKHLKKETVKPE